MSMQFLPPEQRLADFERVQGPTSTRIVHRDDEGKASPPSAQLANSTDVHRGIAGRQHRHRIDAFDRSVEELEMRGCLERLAHGLDAGGRCQLYFDADQVTIERGHLERGSHHGRRLRRGPDASGFLAPAELFGAPFGAAAEVADLGNHVETNPVRKAYDFWLPPGEHVRRLPLELVEPEGAGRRNPEHRGRKSTLESELDPKRLERGDQSGGDRGWATHDPPANWPAQQREIHRGKDERDAL